MNIHDAAKICYGIPDRQLDPPDDSYMTDAEERAYNAWLAHHRAELEHRFAVSRDDAFDEFCRDIFDAEELAL